MKATKLILFLSLAFTAPAIARMASDNPADTPPAATSTRPKANYELAAQWTRQKVGKLIFDTAVTPRWLDSGDRFWYSLENTKGRKFWMVDPVKKTKTNVFDPVKMASQLTTATGLPYDSQHLPITTIRFVKNDTAFQFEIVVPRDAVIPGEKKPAPAAPPVIEGQTARQDNTDMQEDDMDADSDDPQQGFGAPRGPVAGRNEKLLAFECDLASGKLTLLDERTPRKPTWANISPDDKWVVFARNHNLFMMDAANYAKALKKADDPTIAEIQITKDGEEDFGYGIDAQQQIQQQIQQQQQDQQETGGDTGTTQDNKNARVAAGNIVWSRDSAKFALVRRDSRKVEKLWVIHNLAEPRPTLESYRYAMPGDVNIPQTQVEIFDVASHERKIVKAEAFKDQTLRIETERPSSRMRTEHEKTEALWAGPGHDKLHVTRSSRDLHRVDLCSIDTASGAVSTLIEERMNVYIETKPVKFFSNGAEMLWWSERDGWGQYYLYDAAGKLKNQVTKGEFVAEDISYVDSTARVMYLTASGHEPGEDPYYMHFYSAKLDGSGTKLLDPGDASHAVDMADSGRYFVNNSSRVNSAPEAILYDAQGVAVMPLESVDVAPLLAAGYKYPEPFQAKADDGITELYGVMYKPFDFDPNKKYPVVEYVYPGPQTESVTKTFTPRSANMTLANLGFIVIEVGNRGGNPHRSKWYHTYGYGNLRDYGLADKKRVVEELAERYKYIDIDRVGITGHSGGGFMSTAAMLVYPDFFKVAVSESGNHENNVYNNTWSEKHHGVKEVAGKDGEAAFEYAIEKNSEIAKNLKGHLLLSTGDIDNNVHPANTMRLIDALIKARKRFDMIVLPGQRHAYTTAGDYFSWVRMDYFCKYLLGDFDQSVDMWELNRETPLSPKTTPPAGRGGQGGQQQQQQQRRRGGPGEVNP
jgi:dipeptidyl-peptidase 4